MAVKYFNLNVLVSFAVVIAIIFPTTNSQLIVSTKNGDVEGKAITSGGVNLYAYLGIPYAQPPVKQLRFKPPVPVASWNGTLNATRYQYSCIQRTPIPLSDPNSRSIQANEDCLYLNIFTINPSNAANLSVLFDIHGGGYETGSGAQLRGQSFAANQSIVVVTMNYRLGVLGFMTSGESDVKQRAIQANLGLQDQSLALQWVRDNIVNFGGNPNLITIVGESAGASSTAYHLVIPSSRGLFRGAIIQSSPYGVIPSYLKASLTSPPTLASARTAFQRYSLAALCSRSNSSAILACLQGVSVARILSLQNILRVLLPILLSPVPDGTTIPEPLYTAIPAGRFHQVPIIAGTTLNDGYIAVSLLGNASNGITRQRLRTFIGITFRSASQRTRLSIEYQYTNWTDVNSPILNRDQLGNTATDYIFAMPSKYFTDQYSRFVPTYTYVFAYRTKNSSLPKYLKVTHATDLPYTLGVPLDQASFFPGSFTPQEVEFSNHVMSYWGNFVRTGNPTNQNSPLAWPKYTNTTQSYLWLNPTFVVKNKIFAAASAFWNQYLPQLAATSATSRPTQGTQATQATPSGTSAVITQKPVSSESSYMIATFVLVGVAVILLVMVIFLIYKIKNSGNKYQNWE